MGASAARSMSNGFTSSVSFQQFSSSSLTLVGVVGLLEDDGCGGGSVLVCVLCAQVLTRPTPSAGEPLTVGDDVGTGLAVL